MNCELALDRMLEADPEELALESHTELGVHIGGCERCRAVADEILAGQQTLGDAVRGLEAKGKVDAVVHSVRAAVSTRRRRKVVSVALLPLAAAAVFVLLVIRDGGRTPTPPLPTQWIAQADVPSRPVITLPPATNAMVLQTENPKISVVWFY